MPQMVAVCTALDARKMVRMNPKQKTASVVVLTLLLTLVGIHNPTEGYVSSHLERLGIGTYEWQARRDGCNPQLQAELARLESEDQSSTAPITPERLIAIANGPKPGIYRKCMLYREPPPTEVEEPFLSWVSIGALHPLVATTKAVLISIGFLLLWGVCVVYGFRTSPRALF